MGAEQYLVRDYELFDKDKKESIDHILANYIKSNPIIRITWKEVKPKQTDFWELTFDEIIRLKEAFQNNEFESAIKICYDITDHQISTAKLFSIFSAYKWIQEELTKILEVEKREFGREYTIEEINAGVKDFDRFGFSIIIDKVSELFKKDEDEVLEYPYHKVFHKLALDNQKNKYINKLQENANRKTSRNR